MYTFRNWVFTQVALGELIATVIVTLISLFLGVSVYYDVRFYFAYHRALSAFATGQLEIAGPQITAALGFRSDFPPARELAAKIKIDGVTSGVRSGESLDEAEKLLKLNIGKGARPSAATLLGIAVIHLKRIDIAKAAKLPFEAEVKEAEEALSAADTATPGNIDTVILRAHLAFRKGTKESAAEADALLAQAETQMKGASAVKDLPSIDMMVDLYVGQMVIFASKLDWAAARQSAQRILLLRPSWDLTSVNLAVMEARRFAIDNTIKRDELEKRGLEVTDLVTKLLSIATRDPDANKYAFDAAYSLRQSYALAYGNLGDTLNLQYLMNEVRSLDDKRPTMYMNFVNSLDAMRRRPDLTSNDRVNMKTVIQGQYAPLYRLDLSPARRIVVDNNMGVITIDVDVDQALEYFKQALGVAKENGNMKCAVVKRNLCVYYYRRNDLENTLKWGTASVEDDPNQSDLKEFLAKLK